LPALKPASENSLEKRLQLIKDGNDDLARNALIQDYIPFIIRVVSQRTNRYVEMENSDEFSVGMIAFNEAIDKYDAVRGSFLRFAELVIENRLKDLWRKKQQEFREIPLEYCLQQASGDFPEPYIEIDDDSICLQLEIKRYSTELAKFGISFEDLVQETPKHKDTRQNAISLSERISKDKPVVKEIYAKKRLPLTKIVIKFKTSLKILKRSKKFILSIVIIFTGGFNLLKSWVKKS